MLLALGAAGSKGTTMERPLEPPMLSYVIARTTNGREQVSYSNVEASCAVDVNRLETGGLPMSEKFDPAPFDRHAEDPKDALKVDRDVHAKLERGLLDTFPASDPVSEVQPARSVHDSSNRNTFWNSIAGWFR